MRAVLRIAAGIVLMIVVASTDARAQARAVWGYTFLAPGVYQDTGSIVTSYDANNYTPKTFVPYYDTESTVEWGGGVEWAVVPAFGIGAELRAIHLADAPAYPGGVLSVNGSYHFRPPSAAKRGWSPFLTGGYTLGMDRNPGFDLGAGTNYWSRGATGLRLEVRTTALLNPPMHGIGEFEPIDWSVAFRVGVNFGRKMF